MWVTVTPPRALEGASQQRYEPPYAFALVHAGIGEPDAVFSHLERAYATRDVHLIYLPVDPKWDVFRADPRFEALLGRCDFMRSEKPGIRPAGERETRQRSRV